MGVRPADVPPGACGPRRTALIALLPGRSRPSTRATAAFWHAVWGVAVSLGSGVTRCLRVPDTRHPVDAAIPATVPAPPQRHVDATRWREGTPRGWVGVAVSSGATCCRIDPSRGPPARRRLIGDDDRGSVQSDRARVDHAVPDNPRQWCGAHMLRHLQGLVAHQPAERDGAPRRLEWTLTLLAAWRASPSGGFDHIALQQARRPVRLALHDLLRLGAARPWDPLPAGCDDLLRHGDARWTFSRVEGREPTTNTADRAVRPAVIGRKSCYGTQRALGSRLVARMLRVRATCVQQGRTLLAYLTDAVRAAFAGQPVPSVFCTP